MPTASAEEIFLLVKTTPVLFLLDKSLAKQGPATAETFGFLNKFVNISNLSFLIDKPLVSKSNGVFEFEELSSLEIQFIPFELTPKTTTSYFLLISSLRLLEFKNTILSESLHY